MRKSLLIMLAAASAIMLLASCSNGSTTQIESTTGQSSTTVTTSVTNIASLAAYTDPAQPVNVIVNQEFVLALDSNPTTGYDWHESFDQSALKLIEKTYQAKQTATPMAGSRGTDYFHFQALKAGTASITLTYYRAWETPAGTDKTETFTVNVK